jgi:hypothetical protein
VPQAVTEERAPKWIKTKIQHVYRDRDSGRYYVRGFRQGKEIWKALKTTSAEAAPAGGSIGLSAADGIGH